MFLSLSSTCIQNFSNWHALFVVVVVVVFFLSHSVAVAAWSGIACRPTDDPFWAFLSPAAQKPVQPQKNICLVQAAEKKYTLGIHPKKIINPAPFHSKAFVLLYKFETSWALLSRLSRVFFFAISGASNFSNFKHFKQLFMILSRLCLLTMWVVESPVLYLQSATKWVETLRPKVGFFTFYELQKEEI